MVIIPKKPKTFVITGIKTPINIKTACFEKSPEFFIEYFIKINNETAYVKYVYM